MNWEEFKRQITIPFILDLVTQGAAWYVIHTMAGQPVTTAPTVTNSADLKQIGRVAIHAVIVGKKRGQRDEAIFAGLMSDARITRLEQSILSDMLNLPAPHFTDAQKKDFRYIVALMQQIESEDKAIQALKMLGNEPTPQDALAKARAEGLLEPEDPTKVQQQVEEFLHKVGGTVSAAWQKAEASVISTNAHVEAQGLFRGQLQKLFMK